MVLYHLMGVQDIPSEASPHWKVVERWTEQPGGYHRLILESNTAAEECRSGRAKYIVFPQTYLSKQEVFVDGNRIYTNEMDKEMYLLRIIDRVVVSCELFKDAKIVQLSATAIMKYFSSINHYPFFTKKYPQSQFFYELNYLFSAAISLTVTIVATIVLFALKEVSLTFLGMGISIFLLMNSHAPGYIVPISLSKTHLVMMVGAFGLSFFYMRGRFKIFSKPIASALFAVLLFLSILVSIDNRNTTQLIMISMGTLTVVVGIASSIFIKKMTKLDRASLFIVLLAAAIDLYRSQAIRDGLLNLSILIVAVILFELTRVLNRIYNTRIKSENMEGRLFSERKLLNKINEANEMLREAIHALKAPVTSLNFISKSTAINPEHLTQITERFNSILTNISSESSTSSVNWYSLKYLHGLILEIASEMQGLFKNIHIEDCGLNICYAFFGAEDIKNSIAEVLMNSYKAGGHQIGKISVRVKLVELSDTIEIILEDDGGGISNKILKNLGEKGITTGSTGLGLWTIKKKIAKVGGKVTLSNKQNGLQVIITLNKQLNLR